MVNQTDLCFSAVPNEEGCYRWCYSVRALIGQHGACTDYITRSKAVRHWNETAESVAHTT